MPMASLGIVAPGGFGTVVGTPWVHHLVYMPTSLCTDLDQSEDRGSVGWSISEHIRAGVIALLELV